jgi:hypothetical protein
MSMCTRPLHLIPTLDPVLSSSFLASSPFRQFPAIVVFFTVFSIPRLYYHYLFCHVLITIVCVPLYATSYLIRYIQI